MSIAFVNGLCQIYICNYFDLFVNNYINNSFRLDYLLINIAFIIYEIYLSIYL